MQALFEKYGLTYVTGSFPSQLASAWHKVFRLSLPNDFLKKTTGTIVELPLALARKAA